MQNRYVADIGDFGKYGLLKYVASSKLKLGVHWCLVPDEKHNDDGRYISYLKRPKKYEFIDAELFQQLQGIIRNWERSNHNENSRNIKIVERKIFRDSNILFYSKELSDKNLREQYLKESMIKMNNCDMVFFDPDNGIEIKSVGKKSKKAFKYVYIDELKRCYDSGKSLIVYQHKDRTKDCYSKKMKLLKQHFKNSQIFYLSFLETSKRAYFFIIQKEHTFSVRKIIDIFMKSNWNKLFELKS